MDVDEARSARRWHPRRIELRPRDVPHERLAAAGDGGEAPRPLLGKVSTLQHVVGTLAVGRFLTEHGVRLHARRHASGIMLLEGQRERIASVGFVVVTASSMEPRPIWPMLLPLQVLEAVAIDWFAACSVPKAPALDAIEERPADAYLLGWLPREAIPNLQIVTLEPHLGHEFQARYRQAKNHQLRPLEEFPT